MKLFIPAFITTQQSGPMAWSSTDDNS